MGVVSDTDKLNTDLVSAGLISDPTHSIPTDHTHSNGTRYQRVEMLVSSVKECLTNSSKPEYSLVKFCNVLTQQNNESLTEISREIRR